MGGRAVAVGTRVVLWTEPGGYRATRSGERRGEVRQIVLHYDAAGTSAQCFKVLEARGLSVHFLVDLDGTVYQTCDTSARAYHAGAFNDGSVGIEISNVGAYARREELERLWPIPPGVARPARVPPPARPGPLRGRIHGVELWQQDFTDAQYEALGRLVAALCGALEVPAEAPRDRGVLAQPAAWRGIVGHYHLTTDKVDPGPAFDWDRFLGTVRESLGRSSIRVLPTASPSARPSLGKGEHPAVGGMRRRKASAAVPAKKRLREAEGRTSGAPSDGLRAVDAELARLPFDREDPSRRRKGEPPAVERGP